ncbi:hypothetical protein HMPREF9104_02207 [Lentilactobacillus kisonensis F0435]|uniref:Uncharacterized protein n=1 Tax=Lentilactobacillus kisonensis F0435 TaxID=797516 RepID=H1LHW6_9LACO|nr:hypothetical protein HMPREF9104_02207 [Lentilactobacillus kisonensis F0435]
MPIANTEEPGHHRLRWSSIYRSTTSLLILPKCLQPKVAFYYS